MADLWINLPYLILLVFFGRSGLMSVLVLYTAYCFGKGIVLQAMSNRQLTMSAGAHLMIYLRVFLRVTAMAVAVVVMNLLLGPNTPTHWHALTLVFVGVLSIAIVILLTDRTILKEFRTIFNGRRSSA